MELLASFSDWLNPEVVWPVLLSWGGRIVAALLVFLLGRWIVAALVSVFGGTVARADVDETLVRFLSSLVRMTLLVFVVLTAIGVLGIPTANFLAIVGAAGLAVGLALKDSFSNFSSGVMLVFFRPFKVGDFVEAAGIGGTINSVGLLNTIIKTGDNRVITVPNSLIYGDTITNYSAEATRRIDMTVGISYDDDIGRAKALIQGILISDERVLEDPAPALLLMELADSSVNIAIRPWVKSADYWATRSDLLERIKTTLEQNGMSIPYPQHDVHLSGQVASNA